MPTPLFNYAADLHMQAGAWKNRPEIAGDALFSLQQIVGHSRANRLPLVLGGDILDQRRPDAATVQSLLRELDSLDADVLFVQGDHDFSPDVAWPHIGKARSLHNYVETVHRPGASVRVAGLDWTPMNRLQQTLLDFGIANCTPPPEVLVMHESWQELQGIGSTEGSLNDIPWPCLLLTGDYHGWVHKFHDGPHGRIQVVSSGSTAMQAIDEAPEKYFVTVQREDDGTLGIVRHQLVTRAKLDAKAESLADLPAIVAWAQAIGPHGPTRPEDELDRLGIERPADFKPLIRVTYPETLHDVQAVLTQAIGGIAHLFWRPQTVVQDVVIDFDAAPASAFADLLSAVGQLGTPGTPEHDGTCRLLRTKGDLLAELTTMRQEFFDG